MISIDTDISDTTLQHTIEQVQADILHMQRELTAMRSERRRRRKIKKEKDDGKQGID